VRILIFHGYLLGGTGSNVYNAKLVEALVGLGHEVHILSQDRHMERFEFVDAIGSWEDGELRLQERRSPARCVAYRPDIGTLLPTYVADRYEGFEAKPFAECSDEEVADYVARNVAAVAEVAVRARPDVALANHLVMGPLVLARGLADAGVPYAVKVHGSALEYTVKPNRERFMPAAREGLAGASTILVGSRHTAESLWEAMEDPELPARTRLGPPGVDVAQFVPRDPAAAAAGLGRLTERLLAGTVAPVGGPADAFARDKVAAGMALSRLSPDEDVLVSFVGKLIVSKGVDVLLMAWPLVLDRVPRGRLVVVGFGAYREGFERLLGALIAGDLDQVAEIAQQGRALEGGPAAPLRMVLDFLDGLQGEERERYLAAAARLGDQVVMTGRLEHAELADLLPACEAQVVPSTFPEAFGMVTVEGAACAAFPISADHSGLAEVSRALAEAVPPEAAGWLSFGLQDDVVRALAERLVGWLTAPADLRAATREALVEVCRARYSWEGVAGSVIAAAQGRLDELAPPPEHELAPPAGP
jgi:glycosyltransferase involved in cell wall biosynthesis